MRRLFLALLVVAVLSVPQTLANAPKPPAALFSGYVHETTTGVPVSGAHVVVGSITVLTDGDGAIPATPIPLRGPSEDVDVAVTAPGYHPWTFQGLTLRAGEPVELHARLTRVGASPPVAVPSAPTSTSPFQIVIDPDRIIRIGRTLSTQCVVPDPNEPIQIDSMRFVDYVRGVLPNEWIVDWPGAALDAGAVAVKEYGWYNAFVRPKWSSRGYPFDLLDSTCDQVYNPAQFDSRTDAAVQRTWSTVLTVGGQVFPTYYRAYDRQCPIIPGCMGQWGSYDKAVAGQTGYQILLFYYGQRLYLPAVIK